MSAIRLTVAPDHPALAGHFPGMPVVPGVVLLDEALHAIGAALGVDLSACRIASVKFLSPVLPGQAVDIVHDGLDESGGPIRFTLMHCERKIASGVVHRHAGGPVR